MRSLSFILVLAAGFLLAGCLNRPARRQPAASTPPAPAAPASKAAASVGPLLAERAAILHLVYVYVDATVAAVGADEPAAQAARKLALEEAVALTLRDELRNRGYDVRSAEAATARSSNDTSNQEEFTELFALARSVAAGEAPPAVVRRATHLHPNAPPLLCFAALSTALPETGTKRAATPVVLGGYIVDATTGDVLWSHRVSLAAAMDDLHVRQLAVELARGIPRVPETSPSASAAPP
jgi:hypothetical protein